MEGGIAFEAATPAAGAGAPVEHDRDMADLAGIAEGTTIGLAGDDDAEAEAGARRAAFAPIDLVPVLADVAEFYGVVAESRGQVIETALPETLDVVGDRDLLALAGQTGFEIVRPADFLARLGDNPCP